MLVSAEPPRAPRTAGAGGRGPTAQGQGLALGNPFWVKLFTFDIATL